MKQKKLLMILALSMCIFNANAQRRELETEKNGFQWYQITENGKEGAADVEGNVIVPPLYKRVYAQISEEDGLFSKEPVFILINYNGKESVVGVDGKTIIPFERNYSSIIRIICKPGVEYYRVEKKENGNEYQGICDLWGKEIISPKYERKYKEGFIMLLYSHELIENEYQGFFVYKYDGKSSEYKNLRIYLDESSKAYRKNGNNRYYLSSGSNSSELLYKGLYTISSQGRSQTTGGYTGIAGSDMETEIEIYDDHIMVGTTECTFSKVSGGERAYSSRGWGINGWHTYSTYYVDSNYNIRRVDTSSSQFGTDWFEYEVAKGRCTMPKYQPKFSDNTPSYSGGGSSYQSGNRQTNKQNSTKQRKACRACMYTNGKCSVCKGTGRQTSSAAGYSTKTQCRNCGGDGRCPTCGGDGWIN